MLLAIWDGDGWKTLLLIAAIILTAYLIVMWIGALVWTYRDVQARTRDPFTHGISVLLVLLFNLPGILLYLILRPKETLAEAYDRRLGAEALLQEIQDQATCPTCRRKISEDFLTCPYCRSGLRVPCASCGRALATTWVACPYCGADRVEPAAPAAAASTMASSQTAGSAATASGEASRRQRRPSTATYTPPAPKPAADTPADGG
ncbi:MAG TPA: zinc ribbon domain-containing protein [Dehalococcoidia bacterium]|nr:zinc ribbon domain-containing protein [Dehalococcoidia bacterium]